MNSIRYVHYHEIARPLRTTFSTSLGKKDVARSVIVEVGLKDGSWGLGECPTSFTLKDETLQAIKGILAEAASELTNLPIDAYQERIDQMRRRYPANPMTISGLEVALFRSHIAGAGVPEHQYWGSKLPKLETDITIPFLTDFSMLGKWVSYAIGKGFITLKLKVSGHLEEDEKLISKVYGLLKERPADFTLRVDCNQGYTEKTFRQISDFIVRNNYVVELFEQPLPKADYKGLKAIKRHSPVPVILDETVFTLDDLRYAVENDLCDGVNIKIAKSGISESKKIFDFAKKHGVKLMAGCMTETMVGLSAGIHFAAGSGGFDFVDLDSIYFLRHKTRYDTIRIDGPVFVIRP